jgi:hypothetical protein
LVRRVAWSIILYGSLPAFWAVDIAAWFRWGSQWVGAVAGLLYTLGVVVLFKLKFGFGKTADTAIGELEDAEDSPPLELGPGEVTGRDLAARFDRIDRNFVGPPSRETERPHP